MAAHTVKATPRDLLLTAKAKRHGASYSLRIIWEARRAHIPISLGFALIEQESGFRNVFGHDPGNHCGAGTVTRAKYREYLRQRNMGRGNQGVGPAQLTYHTIQDEADRRGGCWVPRHNIAVAFNLLASLVFKHGEHKGLAAYNAGEGGWRNGEGYARSVKAKAAVWHRRLA